MSFILDALKKSEKERQREAVPGIGDLPVVVHQTRTSTWLVAIVAALGLGVIVLGLAWWRTSAPPGPVSVATPPAVPTTTVQAAPEQLPTPTTQPPPATQPETRSLASEAAHVAAAAAERPPATSTANEPLVVQPTPAVVTPAPMSILQARAAGMSVPELALELLVYSDNPAQRFVFINASKYIEGDVLAEGPRLVGISTEGAILSYRGQNFLLPQE